MKLIFAWRHLIAILKICLYKILYGSKCCIGKNTTFRSNFHLVIAEKGKIELGRNCFFNNDCSITSFGGIKIGNGTIFGEGVRIYDQNHKFNDFNKSIKEQGYSVGSVYIGNHCWIGSNVVILKGANIQDNCVIGAGCVINGYIAAGSIVKQENSITIQKIEESGIKE